MSEQLPESKDSGAQVAFVGMSPSREEEKAARPFVGPAGKLLRSLLPSGSKALFTNLVSHSTPENRKPTAKEIKACQETLLSELANPDLKVIVPLGALVTRQFSATATRGMPFEWNEKTVLPTFHPMAVLYAPALYPVLKQHVAYAYKLASGVPPTDIQAIRIYTAYDAEEVCKRLLNEPIVSFDLETNMSDTILIVGLSNGIGTFVFNTHLYPELMVPLKKFFESYMGKLVGHNAIRFDAYILRKNNIAVPTPEDTMITSYLTEEYHESYALEPCIIRTLQEPPWKGTVTWDWSKPEEIPWDLATKYNATDTYLTHKLFVATQLDEPRTKISNQILRPATEIFETVSRRGVYVVPEAVAQARAYFKNVIETSNVSGAPLAVAAYLKSAGISLPLTHAGNPTTGEPTLRLIELAHPELHEYIESVLATRRASKMLSTYINKLERMSEGDGRIHPRYLLTRTVSGRTSCIKPNYENTPRDPMIRSILGAPSGYTFIEADFSQIELRVAAALAPEQGMLDAFRDGKDLHELFAKQLTGKDVVSKAERTAAKIANFALLYCAEAESLRRQALVDYGMNMSLPEAKRIRDKFYEQWPGFSEWYRRCAEEVQEKGQITSAFGMVRHLPAIYSTDQKVKIEALRRGINFVVQSTAAHIALYALVRAARMGLPIVGFCHDAIHFEVKDEYVEQVTGAILQALDIQKPLIDVFGIRLGVSLPLNITKGPSWGQLK